MLVIKKGDTVTVGAVRRLRSGLKKSGVVLWADDKYCKVGFNTAWKDTNRKPFTWMGKIEEVEKV